MKPRLLFLSIFLLVGAVFGSVPSSTTWVQYTLTTNPQTLTVPFVFQSASDLLVLDSKSSPPTTLTINSDYSVSGGSGSTGTISTIAGGANAVQVGDRITISRRVPLTQTTSFVTGGPLTPAMIGQTVDKLTTIVQQLNLVGANSLQFQGDEQISGVLPLNSRKGAFLAFDANGIPWFPTTASIVGSVANPIVANSIAALRVVPTASLVNGAVCQVTGYYAANDGGGGTYVWNSTSTATDNGGTVIQATGVATGRWLLQYSSSINGRWFGAKGDGTTDDTAALTSAANVAIGTSGGALYIPKGTYKISSLPIFTQPVFIFGDGSSSILKPSALVEVIMLESPESVVSNLAIDGSLMPAGTTGVGIDVGYAGNNAQLCSIVNVSVSAIQGSGIVWRNGANLRIENCLVSSNTQYGIYCTNEYNDNNHGLFSNSQSNSNALSGLYIQNNAGTPNNSSRYNVFNDFKAFGNTQYGIKIETILNMGTVYVESNTSGGISLTSTSSENFLTITGDGLAWNELFTGGDAGARNVYVGADLGNNIDSNLWTSQSGWFSALAAGPTSITGNFNVSSASYSVGFGTTSPSRQVQIFNSWSDPFLSLRGAANCEPGILWGNNSTDAKGQLRYDTATDNTIINSGGTIHTFGKTTSAIGTAVTIQNYTVSTLPSGQPVGTIAVVTDSNAAITAGIGAVVAGGGANKVPVFYDGTNWRIY